MKNDLHYSLKTGVLEVQNLFNIHNIYVITVNLSVVILNYQGNPLVFRCIESVFNNSFSDYELIFVDNNSSDGSFEKSLVILDQKRNVKVIKNDKNVGFTKGFDIGINNSQGKYILLLNNDTVLYPDSLSNLIDFMERNPNIGLAEGRIENISGNSRTFSDPRISVFFGMLNEARNHTFDPGPFANLERVFSPVGVWPIIRRDVYDQIGGYDNDYVHFEEIRDLAARVWIFGYEVGYVFNAVIQHVGRLTDVNTNYGKEIAQELYYHAAKNQVMFFLKNYSAKTILKYYLPYITIKTADLFYTLTVLGKAAFVAKIKAYKWILKNISTIMYKRRIIEKNRLVTDDFIMNFLIKPNGQTLKELLKRRNAYDRKTKDWIASSSHSRNR